MNKCNTFKTSSADEYIISTFVKQSLLFPGNPFSVLSVFYYIYSPLAFTMLKAISRKICNFSHTLIYWTYRLNPTDSPLTTATIFYWIMCKKSSKHFLFRGGFFGVKRHVYLYEDKKIGIFIQINMPFWCKMACLSVWRCPSSTKDAHLHTAKHAVSH